MNDLTILGLQLVKDGQDGNPAYKTNGVRAAALCGHIAVSDTAIVMMGVRDGVFRSSCEVGEGKYNSAMCVEWYARGQNPASPPTFLKITPTLLSSFALFSGEVTTTQARDPTRKDHQFLRGVFSAPLGAEIWIEWDPDRI